jgi:uncharacterized protein YacL
MENENKLYEHIREKIMHEDNLINHRIMWAITLNGLLFSAYGFSLMADSGAIAALAANATPSQIAAYQTLISTINVLRQGMVYVGIGSSAAAFVGIAAAFRAIKDDAIFFAELINKKLERPSTCPPPIGGQITNIAGMISGLAVPLLISAVWLWIGKPVAGTWFPVIVIAAMCFVGLSLWTISPRKKFTETLGVDEKSGRHATR